jgi:hypothetical protein
MTGGNLAAYLHGGKAGGASALLGPDAHSRPLSERLLRALEVRAAPGQLGGGARRPAQRGEEAQRCVAHRCSWRRRRLPGPEPAVSLAPPPPQIAGALAALEACSPPVLHRDVKPSNIFLDAGGKARLGDFGLARVLPASAATLTGETGTYLYMAPEMIRCGGGAGAGVGLAWTAAAGARAGCIGQRVQRVRARARLARISEALALPPPRRPPPPPRPRQARGVRQQGRRVVVRRAAGGDHHLPDPLRTHLHDARPGGGARAPAARGTRRPACPCAQPPPKL